MGTVGIAPYGDVRVDGSKMNAGRERASLVAILVVAAAVHLWAIRRDFPYITAEDPTLLVNPAVRIAASGDLNPRRFVHPGSTMIYPLAMAFHTWNATAHGGTWLRPDASLKRNFETDPQGFYLLGRLLAALYGVLGVAMVYLAGRLAFGTTPALLGAWFMALYPTELLLKQVRTEPAALFFAWMAMWAILRLHDRPSRRRQVLAGAAIGVAIATKYYLLPLVGVLVAVDVLLWWHREKAPRDNRPVGSMVAAGLIAIPVAFALTTPYALLDFDTLQKNLVLIGVSDAETRSPAVALRNLRGYLADVVPRTMSWPQVLAAGLGLALVVRNRQPKQWLTVSFLVVFLPQLAWHAWYFARWLIPVFPVLALLAGRGVEATAEALLRRLGTAGLTPRRAAAAIALVLAVQPARALVAMHRMYAHPTTYVLARQWVETNLPPGSRLVYEWETLAPPLRAQALGPGFSVNRSNDKALVELSMSKLSVRGSVEYYLRNGYRYFVTSSLMYAVYPNDPEHYPQQAAFYRDLLRRGQLLHQVTASAVNGGPEIRIYEVR